MDTIEKVGSNENAAKIVYFLYIVGIFVGITSLIGLVVAYVYRKNAPHWLQGHYQFQIRTFWIGLLYLFIGGILSPFFVGWLVVGFWLIWLIIRCVKGVKLLSNKEPHPDPKTWLFS